MDLFASTAVVTGAGRGIGRGVAKELAAAGAAVALVSRTEAELNSALEEIRELGGRSVAIPADLLEEGEGTAVARKAAAELGPVGVFVHAAGGQHRVPAIDADWSGWDPLFAVHVRAAHEISSELARACRHYGRPGSIVYLGSLAAHHGLPNIAGYSMAKSALMGLMRVQATEWGPLGIRVNAIAPGFIRTALTEELIADPAWSGPKVARTPLQRTGDPDDVAGVARFLCSDDARFITGQVVTVDGGWSQA